MALEHRCLAVLPRISATARRRLPRPSPPSLDLGLVRPLFEAARPRAAASLAAGAVAASALVKGEVEAENAAASLADELLQGLGGQSPGCTLWFAKGYGQRAAPVGPLLAARLGDGVIVGSSAEGGIIGKGQEVQEATFALSALALSAQHFRAFPFHSTDLASLPALGGGGSWSNLARASRLTSGSCSPPCVVAFCALPLANHGIGNDPQSWVNLFDRALSDPGSNTPGALPVVVGGLTVGGFIDINGELHRGGGFGVVLEGTGTGVSLDPVVCQGGVPFGPWLKITGVHGDHVITGINDQIPYRVLQPLLHGPEVPGEGHTMAGVFVDPTPASALPGAASMPALAGAALGGRPNCLLRPLHTFTQEGALVLSPLSESLPYIPGMQMQLHCFSPSHALGELQTRAEHDMAMHGGVPPDAAIMIACGARGMQLHAMEGVESRALREVWGQDVPTVGFFAGGEIGPVGLKTYLHGFTTSCLMLRAARGAA